MKLHKKIILGVIVASAISFAPIAFAVTANQVAPAVKTKKVEKVTTSKKIDTKARAAKKNKFKATDPNIIKKMKANEGGKKMQAEAKAFQELKELKAKTNTNIAQ